jgi:hypothetical protein
MAIIICMSMGLAAFPAAHATGAAGAGPVRLAPLAAPSAPSGPERPSPLPRTECWASAADATDARLAWSAI